MKAALWDKYGPPEVIYLGEAPKPEPKSKELLVRVHATTVNRNDCGFRSATPAIIRLFAGITRPRIPILGTEFSGVVEAVGSDVSNFKIGDEVFGRKSDERAGCHAEYLTIREDRAVALKPTNMTFEQAAAIPDGAMLATGYLKTVDPETKPRMLVNGASGSIGSAGVQLARAAGFKYIAAVCKTESIPQIEALGPDRIIDYKKEDFTAMDDTYDVIFDAVGKSAWSRCKHLINDGGVYMSSELGDGIENPLLAIKTKLMGGKKRVYFPLPSYKKEVLLHAKQLAEAGQYTPVVDRVVPLEEIVEAYKYVETFEKIGNVVVRVR